MPTPMGNRSEGSGDAGSGPPDPAIMNERRQLTNVAYRLLGSLSDAEDAVQEAYIRWYAMSEARRSAINSPGAWLTKVTSRICLDMLDSARSRREHYVGHWIPEPVPERAEWVGRAREGVATGDPADRVTLDESISMAFLVVLESMTPAERVAFILRDVFHFPFSDIAEITGRTPGACRQLAFSARRRVDAAQPSATPTAEQARIVRDFKQAWEAMDIQALLGLLDPDAVAVGDGGGIARAALEPLTGSGQIARAYAEFVRLGNRRNNPGAYGQRPAWIGSTARRPHGHHLFLRYRRRKDQTHLGRSQSGETPFLD